MLIPPVLVPSCILCPHISHYILSDNLIYICILNSDGPRTICFGALYVKPELKKETLLWWPDLSNVERLRRENLIWRALKGDSEACESVRAWINLGIFSTEFPLTVGRCKSVL